MKAGTGEGWSFTRFEWTSIAICVGAILARLLGYLYDDVSFDAAAMMQMAASFVQHGEFILPDTNPPQYSHHFPPLYPLLLAASFKLFGPSLTSAETASAVSGIFLVLVAFYCTNDLYGRKRAFAVAAIAATFPPLLLQDQVMYSESLVAALFALTIWAIVKSLDKPAFIVLGGIFAALSYLSKASMGPFFILAGVGGLAWRFYYMRWRVFKDKYYLAAAAIFGATVLAWGYRNVLRFGWPNYETQAHATDAFNHMLSTSDWPLVMLQTTFWVFVFLGIIAAPWLGELRKSIRDVKNEKTSALWMAIVTPTIVAIAFLTAFQMLENYRGFTETTTRYLTTTFIPIMWLGLRFVQYDDAPAPRLEGGQNLVLTHRIFMGAGLAILAATIVLDPLFLRQTLTRYMVRFALVLIGFILLGVGSSYAWDATSRQDKGATKWRAVNAPASEGRIGRGVLLALGVIFATLFLWTGNIVYTIPVGAQFMFRGPKAKALVLAGLFLAAGFAGVHQRVPIEEYAHEINAVAPVGATVGRWSDAANVAWVAPFLRQDLVVKDSRGDWDYLLGRYGDPSPPDPPEGYHTLATLPVHIVRSPGAWAEEQIEKGIGAYRDFPEGVGYVYERDGLRAS